MRVKLVKLQDVTRTLEEDSREIAGTSFSRGAFEGAPISKNRRGRSGELNKLITVIKYSGPVIKS